MSRSLTISSVRQDYEEDDESHSQYVEEDDVADVDPEY